MRAIPALAVTLAIAVALGPAAAQTGNGPPPSARPNTATTTGQAPPASAPGQAPTGHRQPDAAQVPNEAPGITPMDRDIDRNLQICRGC